MIFESGEKIVSTPEVETNKLVDGLGFGEGSISGADQGEISADMRALVEGIITSKKILTPVDQDKDGYLLEDDGCGDGRGVKRIFEGTIERFKSLNRPKVFGGSPAMAVAIVIGTGQAPEMSLQETFSNSISELKKKMIGFGGHTDTHAHGDNCGCGAIDKAPATITSTVKYQKQIWDSISALGVDTTGLDEVLASFGEYASHVTDQPYSGRAVMEEIVDSGKVVKQLDDDHKEKYIVLNTVPGFTINQERIRHISDDKIQVFGVDVWRMQELAAKFYPDNPELQHKALLSELVYTLGVAAILTKGDLPVYTVSEVPELATV